MEISGLGASYLNNLSLPSSVPVHSPENFQEILQRTMSNGNNTVIATNVASVANQSIDKSDRLYELCLELETFIVKNLVNSMRSTVQKSGLVDDSYAGKIYEDMLYDEYEKKKKKNANFGLAEQAYRQLKQYL
jgi:flagellar protein FlgJ